LDLGPKKLAENSDPKLLNRIWNY